MRVHELDCCPMYVRVGHAGVAIRTDVDWLLHAGDTCMDVRQVTDPTFRLPVGLAAFELGITADRRAARRSIEQVRRLWEQDACRIICSHDAADVPRVPRPAATP